MYFKVYGQVRATGDTGWQSVWEEVNYKIPVLMGRWMTLELYILEGDQSNGRFYFAVTPKDGDRQVVFDIKTCTHHPEDPRPDGLTSFNPMKLYTSEVVIRFMQAQNRSIEVFWDNYRLWKNRQPPGWSQN